MATLPAPAVKESSENSIEKKSLYNGSYFGKLFNLMNDRNRLAFALLNYLKGQGDAPLITVKNNKLTLTNISKIDWQSCLKKKAELKFFIEVILNI